MSVGKVAAQVGHAVHHAVTHSRWAVAGFVLKMKIYIILCAAWRFWTLIVPPIWDDDNNLTHMVQMVWSHRSGYPLKHVSVNWTALAQLRDLSRVEVARFEGLGKVWLEKGDFEGRQLGDPEDDVGRAEYLCWFRTPEVKSSWMRFAKMPNPKAYWPQSQYHYLQLLRTPSSQIWGTVMSTPE